MRTIATIIAALILAAASYANPRGGTAAPHHPLPRVCFPAKQWGPAPDHDRPCVYIELYEDGTYRSQVEQVDGDPVQP